ncbi:hypothetical protein TcG_11540 [Trypanosoma cruzi]|nr:hypothetical protein TcG_11540 [Trypanosoma cruzi]
MVCITITRALQTSWCYDCVPAGHSRCRQPRGHSNNSVRETSQRCQSAGERIRPSTQQTHTPPSPPVHSHGNGVRPQPRSQRTRSKQSPKEPHAEAIPHPSMTRRLTPCGRTECTVSTIEITLRPSR